MHLMFFLLLFSKNKKCKEIQKIKNVLKKH